MTAQGRQVWACRIKVAVAGTALALVAGCGSGATQPQPVVSASAAAGSGRSAALATDRQTTPAGLVVVLDPGHNGANATHPATINQLVPDGRGAEKPCNTTGTATYAGYTEHAFNWDVANRVRTELEAHGIRVVMTRNDDDSVGPCVNERAAIGNRANAAAVVSIHADGAVDSGHGFHVNFSSPPLNPSQQTASPQLAAALRNALVAAGFTPATYIGSNGLYARPDLAGLNLSDRPTALVECGNMHNPGDVAVLSSEAGRQRIADAITAGILAYLG